MKDSQCDAGWCIIAGGFSCGQWSLVGKHVGAALLVAVPCDIGGCQSSTPLPLQHLLCLLVCWFRLWTLQCCMRTGLLLRAMLCCSGSHRSCRTLAAPAGSDMQPPPSAAAPPSAAQREVHLAPRCCSHGHPQASTNRCVDKGPRANQAYSLCGFWCSNTTLNQSLPFDNGYYLLGLEWCACDLSAGSHPVP